jgi:hypothetical protein
MLKGINNIIHKISKKGCNRKLAAIQIMQNNPIKHLNKSSKAF